MTLMNLYGMDNLDLMCQQSIWACVPQCMCVCVYLLDSSQTHAMVLIVCMCAEKGVA